MRYFVKDHPRCRSPVGCMSCDEIRYWLVELRARHGWKTNALARFLGFTSHSSMVAKLAKSWIYPGEQLRSSKQIRRILSGEVVLRLVDPKANRWEAVVADSPQPLRTRPQFKYSLDKNGITITCQAIPARNTGIPSFAALGG